MELSFGRVLALVAVTVALSLALAWAIEERRIRGFIERIDRQGVAAFQQPPTPDSGIDDLIPPNGEEEQ